MKSAPTLVLFAALAAWIPPQQTKDNQADVALQAAIKAETVDGNLKGAIEQYKKIAQSGNRAASAKALVRMGECYEKLGDTESRKAFERVVRDFADQKDAAEQARSHLEGPAARHTGISARQVWSAAGSPGSISPDGRYVSFNDPETGDLALHDFTTATDRRLTHNQVPGAHADESMISTDGKLIAYVWHRGVDPTSEYELHVANLTGNPNPRRLLISQEGEEFEPDSWSPDGKWIVAQLYRGHKTTQIGLISVADGSLRVLKSVDGDGASKVLFSPDGKYLAYDLRGQTGQRDVFVLAIAADGGRDTPVVESRWDDYVLGWAPDGKGVLFASDRMGTYGAWIQPVSDGKPTGNPTLVKRDIGKVKPLGVTRNGALYYGSHLWSTELYTMDIDPETRKPIGRPVMLNAPSGRYSGAPVWSPDGRMVAYHYTNVAGEGASTTLMVHDVEKGSDRELKPGLLNRFGRNPWWPDSRSLLYTERSKEGRLGIYRIDVNSAHSDLLKEFGAEIHQAAPLACDGKTIFYTTALEDESPYEYTAIVRADIATREETVLYRRPQDARIRVGAQLSPDGKWIAIRERMGKGGESTTSFLVIPSIGGNPRKVHSAPTRNLPGADSLTWSSDSRHLLFIGRGPGEPYEPYGLWWLPVEGGAPQKLDIGPGPKLSSAVSFSPDGRRLVFDRSSSQGSEVWALENFASALKASR